MGADLFQSKVLSCRDYKNILEQLYITNVLVDYNNNIILVMVIISLLVHPVLKFILTCIYIIGCINNLGNKHRTRIPVDIFRKRIKL